MRALVFTVQGRYAAQGSKNRGANGGSYEASKYLPEWRSRLEGRARLALLSRQDWEQPEAVGVEVTFAKERPKSHWVRNDPETARLKPGVPYYCSTTPDVDKASRAVLDALTYAGVYKDDAKVVSLKAVTLYAGPGTGEPGATVVVYGLPPEGLPS